MTYGCASLRLCLRGPANNNFNYLSGPTTCLIDTYTLDPSDNPIRGVLFIILKLIFFLDKETDIQRG